VSVASAAPDMNVENQESAKAGLSDVPSTVAVTEDAKPAEIEAPAPVQMVQQPVEETVAETVPVSETAEIAPAVVDVQQPQEEVTAGDVSNVQPQPATPSMEEPIQLNVQVQAGRSKSPLPVVQDREGQLSEAIQKVMKQEAQANRQQQVHERATKWANILQSAHSVSKDRPRAKLADPHLRDLTMLAQLDEGIGGDDAPKGFPDSEFVRNLASVAYDNMQSQERGIESLVELDEGGSESSSSTNMVTVDSSVIRRLAEDAAESEFGPTRTCTQRDGDGGYCVLYNDGSRCLRTDGSHALCGYVEGVTESGDLKRVFSVVDIDKLKL